ncbi:unnamed protein product [Schistosoma curassoni]|uniref:Cadherin domain-containing protein n=1 Tax=Schistosoma curassoni TaxID=6186 RepID=A0A183L5C0_9TREM|nr:unnamed protein product [Schistosoma curassoni]
MMSPLSSASKFRFSICTEIMKAIFMLVDDENDNPPVLEQHHYIFDISEGLPRHSLIGQIKSTDADRDKENRYITYELRDVVNINASNFIYVEQYWIKMTRNQILHSRPFYRDLNSIEMQLR